MRAKSVGHVFQLHVLSRKDVYPYSRACRNWYYLVVIQVFLNMLCGSQGAMPSKELFVTGESHQPSPFSINAEGIDCSQHSTNEVADWETDTFYKLQNPYLHLDSGRKLAMDRIRNERSGIGMNFQKVIWKSVWVFGIDALQITTHCMLWSNIEVGLSQARWTWAHPSLKCLDRLCFPLLQCLLLYRQDLRVFAF